MSNLCLKRLALGMTFFVVYAVTGACVLLLLHGRVTWSDFGPSAVGGAVFAGLFVWELARWLRPRPPAGRSTSE